MYPQAGTDSNRAMADPRPLTAGIAVLVSAAAFGIMAVALPLRAVTVVVVLWTVICGLSAAAAARRFGPLYGVPLAIAVGLALDAFYIPPTRELGRDDWQNWLVLAIYLVLGTVVGWLAARTRLRADVSEVARRDLACAQYALRRVATSVAEGASSAVVFGTVAAEVGLLFGADTSRVIRYANSGAVTVGSWSRPGEEDLPNESVVATLHEVPAIRSDTGLVIGAPITVDGQVWGVLQVANARTAATPAELVDRLAEFTELAATAVANAEVKLALAASRERIVISADETRRRIERDLHDGLQQRLVSLTLRLRALQPAMGGGTVGAALGDIITDLNAAQDELREFARGIHPAILASGGLEPALRTLARRSPVPVELEVTVHDRLPQPVEVGAYFVVSEALTNAAKHAQASLVTIVVDHTEELMITIYDNGIGGADIGAGSGLIGMMDRAEALGGRVELESPAGSGTTLKVTMPVRTLASRR